MMLFRIAAAVGGKIDLQSHPIRGGGFGQIHADDNPRWLFVCQLCSYGDEEVNHIISEYNTLTRKKCKTGWEKWSTGNCAKDLKLTRLTNTKCTNQNHSKKMRRIKLSGVLSYKWITQSQLEYQC